MAAQRRQRRRPLGRQHDGDPGKARCAEAQLRSGPAAWQAITSSVAVDLSFHDEPSKCSATVDWPFCCPAPTAQTSEAEVALTDSSTPSAAFGAGTIDQREPFQCSMSGTVTATWLRMPACPPTSHT